MADAKPDPASKHSLDGRIADWVLRDNPFLSIDNLRFLQSFLVRTPLGAQATRVAKRTETLMRKATTKALDMTTMGQSKFFADLEKLTAKLRERMVAIGEAHDGVAKAAVELERALGGYDSILEEIAQLVRPGVPKAPESSTASRTPTRRAQTVKAAEPAPVAAKVETPDAKPAATETPMAEAPPKESSAA